MPNWCSNNLTLTHEDPVVIDRAVKAFTDEKFFNEFIPLPESEKENWYEWCTTNWGTKWDVGGRDDQVERLSPNEAKFNFDSAWSPPIIAYDNLTEQGFNVEATYYEPGMAFVGEYQSEFGDNSYEIPQTSAEVRDVIPQHLDEEWGISEYMEDSESEEQWDDDENLEIDLGEPPEEDDDGEDAKE